MLPSYFKIALRYLAKSKVYSLINVAGLSIGLACAMLILLYTKDELSFDAFHENADNIYQVTVDVRFPDGSSMEKMGVSSLLLGPYMKSNLPEVQSSLRLAKGFWDMKLGDVVQSQPVMVADSNFFNLLTFPLIHGNPRTALQHPNNVVISEDMAVRHFSTTDAIGKIVQFRRSAEFESYVVNGVAKRVPQNSSIQFDVLLPFYPKPEELGNERWVSIDVNTLLQLHAGSDVALVASKMQELFEKVSQSAFEPVRASGFTQMFHHNLQPLKQIHLGQDFKAEFSFVNGSNPLYAYILGGIALFILIIACINFVNLTIARSIKRAKEIGIRKVVGSGRQQLIGQFLGESFLLCLSAFIVAMLLAQLALPLFNTVTNKALSLTYLMDAKLILLYGLLFIATALLAGFYPAVVLSGFNPVQTLYNQFRLPGRQYLQKGLVIFQFVLATLMILGTLTVYLQFEFLTNKDLGYDSNNLVHVPVRNLTIREAKLFREALMKNPDIVSAAPFRHGANNAKITGDSIRHFTYESVDENFTDILKLQIVEGRNFSSEYPGDSSHAVLVNEAFVRMAALKEPIGQKIDFFLTGEQKLIVGIVKDYHFASLRDAIAPQCFGSGPEPNETYRQMLIRIKPNSEANSLPFIGQTFKSLFPMQPYTYQFDDEQNKIQYAAEAKWKQVILLGAILTIFISGIGLFGLSILISEKRIKEIGIRKVLGASTQTIVLALSRDYVLLILVALLIAMPVGYFAGNLWLRNYPYRIPINLWIFATTAGMVLIAAIATVSYQSIKTALRNPVESLKME